MPPSGFSKYAVQGALQFIQGCYEDLQQEVESGKHPDFETAVAYEIKQIDSALTQLHINEQGELINRPIS